LLALVTLAALLWFAFSRHGRRRQWATSIMGSVVAGALVAALKLAPWQPFPLAPLTQLTESTVVASSEYTYRASDADSKLSSRAVALEQVKRLLLEKVATYVQSILNDKRDVLVDGKSVSLQTLQGQDLKKIAAWATETKVLAERWDGQEYWLKAEIRAEPEATRRRLAQLVSNGGGEPRDFAAGGKRVDSALAAAAMLRNQMDRQTTQMSQLRATVEELRRHPAGDDSLRRVVAELARRTAAAAKMVERYTAATSTLSAKEFVDRGIAASGRKDFQEAMRQFDEALRIDPQYALAYEERGNAKYWLDDSRGAIADYDDAVRLDPKFVNTYVNRGRVKGLLGDHRGALADLNDALRLDPKKGDVYFDRGVAKHMLGDSRGAIADFDDALRLDPENQGAYNNRGLDKRSLGDINSALADFNDALRLDPKDAGAYYNRGLAKGDLGDRAGSVADFKRAAGLGDASAQQWLKSQGLSR
jgi:tetratricopeptide (TPR) repeat protein